MPDLGESMTFSRIASEAMIRSALRAAESRQANCSWPRCKRKATVWLRGSTPYCNRHIIRAAEREKEAPDA